MPVYCFLAESTLRELYLLSSITKKRPYTSTVSLFTILCFNYGLTYSQSGLNARIHKKIGDKNTNPTPKPALLSKAAAKSIYNLNIK